MEAPVGHIRLSPEVWKEIFAHLPMMWRAMCCRVCKAWREDLEQPQQGHGDEILVDYGLGTLCSALATKGVDEVMRRIRLHSPSGISADLGRMDQVRRFVQRPGCEKVKIKSVDEWMQMASQEPDTGWLCKAVSKINLEGMDKSLVRQVVGKPQDFSKLLDSLTGQSEVGSVAYSPDGSTIAIGGSDTTVRLCDAKTMVEKGALKGHSHCVGCVAYSPDGKRIASASVDKTVRIWDAVTMEEVDALRGHTQDNPDCTCVHNKRSYDDEWEVVEDPECPAMGHTSSVRSVAYSPDSKILASASCDRTVMLWDLSGETPVEKGTLKGHSGWVNCVAYSPDGKHIATASSDKSVRIWDAETQQEVCSLRGHTRDNPQCACFGHGPSIFGEGVVDPRCRATGHNGRVACVAFSLDGSILASAGASGDQTVWLWDPKTLERRGSLKGVPYGHVECVAFSPDGSRIATGGGDNRVRVWDAETGQEVWSMRAHWTSVDCVAYSPDGKSLASASGDKTVKLWDPSGELAPVEKRMLVGGSREVTSVAYSPDGSTIATSGGRQSRDNAVHLWDAEEMKEKGTLTGHSRLVSCVAYSPDNKSLASASYDKTVKLWDLSLETPVEKGTLTGHSGHVRSVAWSPDGEMIASGSSDSTIRLWSKSGEHKGTLKGHTEDNPECTCKPLEEDVLLDWDYEPEDHPVCPAQGHADKVNCVAFSPDSKFVASGSGDTCNSRDNSVRVWDVSTGREVGCLKGHYYCVQSVAYSPDGKRIASASSDQRVKIWDAVTMEKVGSLKGNVASWQHLDPETVAAKAREGGPARSNVTGHYLVAAKGRKVYVYWICSDGGKPGGPLACFLSPESVSSVSCKGTSVVVGCGDGQVSRYLPCGADAALCFGAIAVQNVVGIPWVTSVPHLGAHLRWGCGAFCL